MRLWDSCWTFAAWLTGSSIRISNKHPLRDMIFCGQESGKEKKHEHKQLRDCPRTGWVPKFCFCVFFGSFLMGSKKHINKVPPKIPGQSRETFLTCLFIYVFFSLPKKSPRKRPEYYCRIT